MSRATTDLVDRLRPEHRVRAGSITLSADGAHGSVRASVDKEAVKHSGRDPGDPGEVDYYYVPDLQLFVLDLGGQFQVDESGLGEGP
jgi:hypothetical protein